MFILFILTLLCLAIIWLATTAIFVAAACFCSLTVLVLEMRRREYYEKPSEISRRNRRRAERRARLARLNPNGTAATNATTGP